MRRSAHISALTVFALVVTVAGCANGSGDRSSSPKLTNCTNKMMNDAPQVSVWAWYPNMEKVVDNFNKTHTDVQVCWTIAGQGAPDVIMLEADQLIGFEIQKALVDLVPYGANGVMKNFGNGAWKDVSQGDQVYAIPVDGGPMAMIYRKDIFDKYGIVPPKTWDEYEQVAQKVKDAGGPLFGDLGSNVPAWLTALITQKGSTPFVYDLKDPKNIKIKLDGQASKDVLTYWAGLVKKGLVGTQDQFTADYISGVVGGKYATYVSAAWAPGYLTGAGVGKGSEQGQFAVAPLPQWKSEDAISVNWGGSAFAVTTQASNKKLAAIVAKDLYADEASLTDGWATQTIFPLNKGVLASDPFINSKVAFFNGQTANKDVYIPAANSYKGFSYSPFTVYYYAQLQAQVVKINAGQTTGEQAAIDLQTIMVKYATSQGFTVK